MPFIGNDNSGFSITFNGPVNAVYIAQTPFPDDEPEAVEEDEAGA